MSRLDLRAPPDLVALLVAGAMWLVSRVTPSVGVAPAIRVVAAAALFAAGMALIVVARVEFARASTTFSPVAPQRSSHLVTTGVYRFSRNPMYLGTLLVLLGLAALLSNVVSAVVALAFVVYTDRFQIAPEERALSARFGREYEAYRHTVRRWI